MKKLIIAAAIAGSAILANAASVGWTIAAGSTAYAGDAYALFIVGQNGVTSVAQITELLASSDASSYSDYAFGSGKLNTASGTTQVAAGSSGLALGSGTYTAMLAIFDSDTPTAGTSKYVMVSGNSGLTKTVGDSTASITFTTGNISSTLSNAGNWSTYAAPEPTSGLLLLLGVAGLALRRKRA